MALLVGVVLIATVCDDPATIDAQPDKATLNVAIATIAPDFIEAPTHFPAYCRHLKTRSSTH
jgi:hypothetical protein